MMKLTYFLTQCGSFEEAVESLCLVALEKLNALFLHMDSRVLNAVSAACHHLLQSELGNRLGGKLEMFSLDSIFSTYEFKHLIIYF